ncbi:MAG: zinc-ribbon domain-containing protein [Clostridia bacterium]|nr:zinc-ribbon domain-containing protein [Clostridia bacterium]
MAFCRNCGTQIDDGAAFCPNCGTATNSNVVPVQKQAKGPGGPLFWRIYTKAFKALIEKPIRLWGISLLGALLICVGGMLAGFAIPALAIAVAMLFNVSLAAIFLKGYHREQVYCYELFDTFKDWGTIKRVLTGMGWSYLWIFLWALIPIVGPVFAIIKGYEHGLVPYILVKKPELNAIQARELSIEKTKGHKWQMFLADFLVGAAIGVVFAILGGLSAIRYVGVFFAIVFVLLYIGVIVLLPLFLGLVHAAFYEELIGDEEPAKETPAEEAPAAEPAEKVEE